MRLAASVGPVRLLPPSRFIDDLAPAIGEGMQGEFFGGPGKGTMRARTLDAQIGEIGILPAIQAPIAIGGDRGQLGPAKLPVRFGRQAPIPHVGPIGTPRRDRHAPRKRVVVDDRPQRTLKRSEGVRLGYDLAADPRCLRGWQKCRRATVFIALRIIGDQTNIQGFGRIQLELAPDQITIAIVEPAPACTGIIIRFLEEAIPLGIDAIEPVGDQVRSVGS